MVDIKNLSKNYGKVQALKNVSLNIDEGTVFALLGPNGAGKTTLVKVLLNLVHSSQGEILLNNKDSKNPEARVGVSYLPEKFGFFSYYTVGGVAEFYGQMQGVKGEQLDEQVNTALSRLNILDLKKRKMNALSKGQIQRTGLASMLMGDNDLIILDEPFSGLDPIGIKELKDLIQDLKKEGKSIFINSHILSEMEQICDEMAILNKGELVVSGKIKELIGSDNLENYFYNRIKEQ
jgi:ABC-2 type transport system ATP-binding protein